VTPALGPTNLRVERGGPSGFQSGLASQPSEFQPRPSESPKTAIPKYAHGYDGSTSWQAFLTLFEANATAVEWTDKEATLVLVNSLKGQAVTTLQALPPNAIVTGDYQAVGRHLSDSFAASTTTRAAKYSLCSRKQLEGESICTTTGRPLAPSRILRSRTIRCERNRRQPNISVRDFTTLI